MRFPRGNFPTFSFASKKLSLKGSGQFQVPNLRQKTMTKWCSEIFDQSVGVGQGNTIDSCGLCCVLFCGWGRVVMMKVMKVMMVMLIIIIIVCFHLRIGIILKILDSSHRMVHFIILQFPAVLCCILVFNLPWTPNSYSLFIFVSHLCQFVSSPYCHQPQLQGLHV